MATSAWGKIRDDTAATIVAVSPTIDAGQRWKHVDRAPSEELPRARAFRAEKSTPRDGVQLYGAGEQQVSRVLLIETAYQRGRDYHDRRAADEVDLEEALAPTSSYIAAGSWGALKVRRVLRDEVDEEWDDERGTVQVTYPVLHIYREPVSTG
jgi:hypothetical protein